MKLYRPAWKAELDLIKQSDFTEFPPRLPEQPIFYPVLNVEYAREIASKWNTHNDDGYVLAFEIDDNYVGNFIVQTVGSHVHQEYWIPSDELENFNRHIVGKIEVLEQYKQNH
ncbi:hypothetical protein AGMMS49975_19480 [Clostridia bacterium]|nr:hypothetical protein AGMMS49975_19480 [Clostridia bacterium]